MNWRAYLRLSRISNLPTVWSNVLAGVVLAGGRPSAAALLWLGVSLSLFYTGGMFLNDAFDREIDARERPERPIPAGEVGVGAAFGVGFVLLAAGWSVLLLHVWQTGGRGGGALLAGAALAGVIVLYDAWHKGNPLSPVVMGLCRALAYLVAGLAVSARPTPALLAGALVILAYLIGLTYAAKQENLARVQNLWPLAFLAAPFVYAAGIVGRSVTGTALYAGFLGWTLFALWLMLRRRETDIRRAVVGLIAGISLVDALLIARHGPPALAWLAVLAFAATLFLQRYVRGS